MNQEKAWDCSPNVLFQKMLGIAVPGHFWAIFVKNVNREMGQICNISFWPLFTIKLGEKRQKWQNLRRQTSPQPCRYVPPGTYWSNKNDYSQRLYFSVIISWNLQSQLQHPSPFKSSNGIAMSCQVSLRVRGGEPEGVRKHLLSKKVFLCSKKVFRRKKAF